MAFEEQLMRGDLRLLVVDDEPVIRSALVKVLNDQGFHAEQAEDGVTAVKLIQSSAQPFDLLVTDIVMPGLNGLDLAEMMIAQSPRTKILIISAYAPPMALGMRQLPFLQKPFDLQTFVYTVRTMLNSWAPTEPLPPHR
jgi:DNA-binding NtrC family response regulator